jgi:hypothetical protein
MSVSVSGIRDFGAEIIAVKWARLAIALKLYLEFHPRLRRAQMRKKLIVFFAAVTWVSGISGVAAQKVHPDRSIERDHGQGSVSAPRPLEKHHASQHHTCQRVCSTPPCGWYFSYDRVQWEWRGHCREICKCK